MAAIQVIKFGGLTERFSMLPPLGIQVACKQPITV
jgi:hypothetical protein